jgi:peptide/nickel transport system ATP-binding protein
MEVPLAHETITKKEAWQRSLQMLTDVNLPDPESVDGMPIRTSCRADSSSVWSSPWDSLSNPSLLLLDEPTTALDVTVEAGIVKLVANISKQVRYLPDLYLPQSRADPGDL